MRMGLVVLACGLALAGCTSEAHIRVLEHDGHVAIVKATTPDADYVVSVKNYVDIGYEPDDRATRETVALRYASAQCPNGKVVDEDVIETGTNLLGRKMRTYQMRVKC